MPGGFIPSGILLSDAAYSSTTRRNATQSCENIAAGNGAVDGPATARVAGERAGARESIGRRQNKMPGEFILIGHFAFYYHPKIRLIRRQQPRHGLLGQRLAKVS